MADRIYPRSSPPSSDPHPNAAAAAAAAPAPSEKKYPEAYVIQVPKDQIHRPSPARRLQYLSRPEPRRRCCCGRCLCCALCFLLILLLFLAAAAGVCYLVFRPELPGYSVDRISISGFNLSSSSSSSPAINISIRADNPNDKIRIRYRPGSAAAVRYEDVELCRGRLPVFLQPSNNVTVFPVLLKGTSPSLALPDTVRAALARQQRRGRVLVALKVKAPVSLQMGSLKTWKFTVSVHCDLTVSSLTAKARIVSRDCSVRVKPW